jgi:hypothetical protein
LAFPHQHFSNIKQFPNFHFLEILDVILFKHLTGPNPDDLQYWLVAHQTRTLKTYYRSYLWLTNEQLHWQSADHPNLEFFELLRMDLTSFTRWLCTERSSPSLNSFKPTYMASKAACLHANNSAPSASKVWGKNGQLH